VPASWLPVRRGLSPHGLRHGHQTWLDDLGVREMLRSEQMGHEVPGMAGVYGDVMPEWRDRLRTQLQELWETSLHNRARLSPRSTVGLVDRLLAPHGAARTPSGPTHSLTARTGQEPRRQNLPEQGFHVGWARVPPAGFEPALTAPGGCCTRP